jgi:hypothetical protein
MSAASGTEHGLFAIVEVSEVLFPEHARRKSDKSGYSLASQKVRFAQPIPSQPWDEMQSFSGTCEGTPAQLTFGIQTK